MKLPCTLYDHESYQEVRGNKIYRIKLLWAVKREDSPSVTSEGYTQFLGKCVNAFKLTATV